VIVLDTHAWIWWVANPEKLTRAAEAAIETAKAQQRIHISCMSAWEVALLCARGRLELTMPPREWIARSEALPFLTFIPVNNAIALRSAELPSAMHPDPADRIIVATALSLGATLVTKDDRIRSCGVVKTIW
jgi:PIN domain nuclease of toxin-antitoxin system